MERWTQAARHFLAAHENMSEYADAVGLDVEFVFRRPDTHYKRKIRGDDTRLRANISRIHTQKPDVDNLVKFVGDCLSGLAFVDDSQITVLNARKRWDHHRAFTKVTIKYFNKSN